MSVGRAWRGSGRGRRRGCTVGQALLESLDAIEQRLVAGARLAPRDAHDRDFEDEPRIGDGLAADVDDRLAEDLDRADDGRVAHLLGERDEALAVLGRAVVGHAARRVGLEERVAQGAQEVVGDPADVVTGCHEVVDPDERATRRRRGAAASSTAEPQVERRAAEGRLHLLRVELTAADRQRLVEQ